MDEVTVGSKIDALYNARAARLALEAEVKALKEQETSIRLELIEELNSKGLVGAKGNVATATVQNKVRPVVTDWDAVYAYIANNELFGLLHQRITATLWMAMRDDGENVPGIVAESYQDLSLTKASRG